MIRRDSELDLPLYGERSDRHGPLIRQGETADPALHRRIAESMAEEVRRPGKKVGLDACGAQAT